MKSVLDRQSILLLSLNSLFVLAGALSGTFLNVYLWKVKQDFTLIGWFSFSQQLAIGITFWLVGKWVKEWNKMIILRLGMLISGLFYLLVLAVGARLADYVWPLGILSGMGLGVFWLAFNVIYFEVTDKSNRDRFNGWVGVMGAIIGIFAPWLSGWLITIMQGNRGYRVIFTLSLAVYGLGVVVSLFLKKRQASGHYHWMLPFRQFEKGNPWRQATLASITYGLREGVYLFLVHLLVYISTTSEWRVGQYMLITSFVALISYWACGKWFKIHHRVYEMLAGVCMLALISLPLLWKVNYMTLIIFGIGNSLFMPLYIIPFISSIFDLMGRGQDDVENRVELIVLREIGMMVGRLIGILLFIVFYSYFPQMSTILWMMALLGLAPFLSWLAMRRLLATG